MAIKVGYSISDIAAIKSLPTALLVNGYARLCRSTNSWFSYDSTSSVTANDISVLLPASGTGRWFKLKADVVDASIGDTQVSSLSQSKITNLISNLASKLSANQNITISGDATGNGSTVIALTFANSGVVAGSYTNANVTVDSKGRVITAANGSTSGGAAASVFTTTTNGLVPLSGTNTNKFLKGDGTWSNQGSGVLVGDSFWDNVTLLCPFKEDLKNIVTNSLPSTGTTSPICPNADNQKPLSTTNSAKWVSEVSSRVQFPCNFNISSLTQATFEAYLYISSIGASNYLDFLTGSLGTSEVFYFRFEISSNNFQIILFNTSNTVFVGTFASPISSLLNLWVHFAVTKNGNLYSLYLNGMLSGSVTVGTSGTLRTATSYNILGLGSSPALAYCSYFRITEGIVRYTSNFTVPTLPYKMADVIINNNISSNLYDFFNFI